MKRHGVVFETIARVYVEVDADDGDAVDFASDLIDEAKAEFGKWECVDWFDVDPND